LLAIPSIYIITQMFYFVFETGLFMLNLKRR
jgi:hypothetical protein